MRVLKSLRVFGINFECEFLDLHSECESSELFEGLCCQVRVLGVWCYISGYEVSNFSLSEYLKK